MNKRRVVKIELVVLACLAVLVLTRVMSGPPATEGEITLSELKAGRLAHGAFAVTEPTTISIQATGSFEAAAGDDEGSPVLAAFPWIIDRASRHVVWRMDAATSERDRATIARTTENVQLGPGTYDLYFASYGQTHESSRRGRLFGRLRSHWTNDARNWEVAISAVEGGGIVEANGERAPSGPNVVWTTGPLNGNRLVQHVFRVDRPLTLRVYSIGELCDDPCDYGWIENLQTHEKVWQLDAAQSSLAGGGPTNRYFDGPVFLERGTYRAVFTTDPGHAFGNWYSNPPYDPYAWGMTIFAQSDDDFAAVHEFDLWRDRTALLRIKDVPNDAHESRSFVVTEQATVVVSAEGELRKSGNRYDYGWIVNDDNGEVVWEMSWGASLPAGGHHGNRQEEAFVTLAPGMYTLHYQTDDSHAFGSWSNGVPDHPDRWGVALFPLDEDFDTGTLVPATVATPLPPSRALAPLPPLPPMGTGPKLADLTGLGNEQNVGTSFELDAPAAIRIRALGELAVSGSYDFGWIVDERTSETVWQMSRANTQPAGGDDRNRLFDGIIKLDAGKYTVHFKTDFSHALGNFEHDAPDDPDAWGIVVERVAPPRSI